MVVPGTPLAAAQARGEFQPLDGFGMLGELACLVEHLADFRCLFFANHASNYYPVAARFPREKGVLRDNLRRVLARRDRRLLTPEQFRGL
jgi:hypothetical protein